MNICKCRPFYAMIVFLLLGTCTTLQIIQAAKNSPMIDEVGHLPAGISVWMLGRFDLYRVNPPLARCIAALPAVVGGAETDWSHYDESSFGRPEWLIGQSFIEANEGTWFRWFLYGRWMLIPFSILGGYVCYNWSCELYGEAAGVLSLTMWCFCPNMLAWGATITPDITAASLGLLAGWLFWRWLKFSGYRAAFIAGVALGFAEIAKMTWLILFTLWPALWILWRLFPRSEFDETSQAISRGVKPLFRSELGQLLLMMVLGLYLVNVGYGFTGTFRKLGDYTFGTRLLAGKANVIDDGMGGNRFRGTCIGAFPMPVPQDYLTGIDLQRIDFEKMKPSYLNGVWKDGGWWYYYFEAIALKVPLGYWLVGLMSLFLTFFDSRYREKWKDEIILLMPVLAVFALVSSQTGFSRYIRYVLPCFPYAFIWCGKVAQSWRWNQTRVALIAALGLAWGVVSSLWVFPHSISYFNEISGGPNGGHRYLLDANIDWGQDVFYYKEWYDQHPEARQIYTDFYGLVREPYFGIESLNHFDPATEWYAISVHRLFGKDGRYEWLWRDYEPVAKAGYSIWIFHVPRDRKSKSVEH